MTDLLQTLISETIRKNQEIIKSLHLQNQALSAQLPTTRPIQDDGYFTDPKTGKRMKYGPRPRGKRKKLHLIKKEVL